MSGNDKVRFCSHCDLSVNNISALTRKQAMKLVRQTNGRICIHYVKNPVDNKPLFADKLYKITRRAGIAAGVLSATLSLSTLAHAQGEPVLKKRNAPSEILRINEDKDRTDAKTAGLTGFVTTSSAAVMPNVLVHILNEETNEAFSAVTGAQGEYKFSNLAPGNYRLTLNGGPAFADKEINGVAIAEGSETRLDLSMESKEIAVVNITDDQPQVYTTIDGGAMFIEFRTGLHLAVSNNNADEVRNLIARGENVNRKDENYSHITPLFLAVENGSAEIAETLLNFGAKINARDDSRQTPLMRLDEDATVELVGLLVKHGAKVNLIDRDGNTALILSARAVKTEVLQMLLGYAANVNARNREGRTALMEAADADNLENVRALLAAGADVNLKDKNGETAFDLTTDAGIENLLTQYGAAPKEAQP